MNKVLCVGKRMGNSPMTIKYAGSKNVKPVSYTHLTLPTNSLV